MVTKPGLSATFSLTDHHGNGVTAEDFSGLNVLIYFGFTHCRVVCPRSLAKLSSVVRGLDDAGLKIKPLYVTVDPERDTPEVMKDYLKQNHPQFTGLTGSVEAIERVKQDFRVFALRKEDPEDPDGYAVPHTAIAYLIGPDGIYLDHFPDSMDEDRIFRRIEQLIAG
ncbi:MAG: SCO family protein [Haliea sp.]|uniref:SCO family protein n=1 Tax=Marinobacter salarius TaxID=1420917 RepID=UPI0032EDAFE7